MKLLIGQVEITDDHGSQTIGPMLRQLLTERLRDEGFQVTNDPQVPHDLELSVHGSAKTQSFPMECLLGCGAVAAMTVTRAGAEVIEVAASAPWSNSERRYMTRLCSAFVDRLLKSDAFVAALESGQPTPPQPAPVAKLLAILPFEVRAQAIDGVGRDTLEEAIRTLAGDAVSPRGYRVLPAEAVQQRPAQPADVARELNAALYITGTIAKEGDGYVVFVRLFATETGRQLASVQLEGSTPRDIRHDFEAKAADFFMRGLDQLPP